LEIIGKAQIDVSPAPLFPHYDSDTNILFAFSKGERTCHAYEVNSADKNKPFTKLPSFEHGQLQSAFAFLPKQTVDVRKVEVARAYRLTPASIQHVSFSIPRAKMDFFQDDIFPPTLDKLAASSDVGPQEWESGRDVEARYVNLRPEGMALRKSSPSANRAGTS
jgi:coronin-7